jgi:pimeloyl-ACP methyl ester carboxylesterase
MTTREPLLLLHGLMMSAGAWADVVPLLTGHHDVIAHTAAGHRGGHPLKSRATIATLTDEAERMLDARGLGRIHVAGNSMGGWMAIELARRGRALTVCAFSPAGFWTPGMSDEIRASRMVRRTRRRVRMVGPVAPALLRFRYLRRVAMRDAAEHGDRLTPAQALDAARDTAHCPAATDLLEPTESIAPLDPLPCPITLAWSGNDRILPPHVHGATARERLPQATYLTIPDVGHVPMIDDPRACADTILTRTGALVGR